MIDDKGNLVEGKVSDNTRWHGFGKPIYAVADGEIVIAVDDKPRQTRPVFPRRRGRQRHWQPRRDELGESVYALYAHMQTRGVAVKVGAHVKKADVIGHLGNSGNSTAPHLHFHLMDGPDPLVRRACPFVLDPMTDRGMARDDPDLLHGNWRGMRTRSAHRARTGCPRSGTWWTSRSERRRSAARRRVERHPSARRVRRGGEGRRSGEADLLRRLYRGRAHR